MQYNRQDKGGLKNKPKSAKPSIKVSGQKCKILHNCPKCETLHICKT